MVVEILPVYRYVGNGGFHFHQLREKTWRQHLFLGWFSVDEEHISRYSTYNNTVTFPLTANESVVKKVTQKQQNTLYAILDSELMLIRFL